MKIYLEIETKKMKKLIFILGLFISTVSFGQTKEETIDWLNTYANKFTKPTTIQVSEEGILTKQLGFGKTVINLSGVFISDIKELEYKNGTDFFYRFKINGKNAENFTEKNESVGFSSEVIISGKNKTD